MKGEIPIIKCPTPEEETQMEQKSFWDAIEGFVFELLRAEKEKNYVIISPEDLKNATEVEKINEKLITDFFKKKGVKITKYIDGEDGKEYFQFTNMQEKSV